MAMMSGRRAPMLDWARKRQEGKESSARLCTYSLLPFFHPSSGCLFFLSSSLTCLAQLPLNEIKCTLTTRVASRCPFARSLDRSLM